MAKKELKVPFVQLCNGKFAYLQRYFGPALGSMLTFTVPYYDEKTERRAAQLLDSPKCFLLRLRT